MGPDPTRAYFWPAVNKRQTRPWPGYFLTWPEEIFFDPKGKKLKNLMFLGELFQIQTQTIDGWPGSKIIDPDPSLVTAEQSFIQSCEMTIVKGFSRGQRFSQPGFDTQTFQFSAFFSLSWGKMTPWHLDHQRKKKNYFEFTEEGMNIQIFSGLKKDYFKIFLRSWRYNDE